MSRIEILPEDIFKTSAWSGGVTTELFIWPEGSSYSERRFSARISTAVCELPESRFTPLPGVTRFLTPLCPGFELTVNGVETPLPHGSVLRFSGEDEVACRGSGRDLNLMLKGAEGEMRIESGVFTVEPGLLAFAYAESPSAIAYCAAGAGECSSAFLPSGSFAKLPAGSFKASAPIVVFTIRP